MHMINISEMVTQTPQNLEAPHLLIVDDEPEKAIALKDYMERQGCMVSLAYGGEQALQIVQEERPDLVILDLVMPDMDGLAICQQLKQDSSLGYLPVIVVTDDHEKRKRLEVRLSGADDYLPKPVNEQDLFLRVLALLRTKGQLNYLITENQTLTNHLKEQNTELEKTLDHLRKAMQLANQAELLKKHITESVEHELRTPMLQIKSAVAILVEVVDDLSKDEKNHTVAQMATQAVGRMEELIHNISQLHLIENLKSAPFLVNDAIVQSIHSLRRSWARRHEIHRVKYQQGELKPVIADRRAVSRILFLLLDNALKFSPKESFVEIRTQEEQIDPERPRQVVVRVIDKGIGIPPEKLDRIFEPFFQVDTGTTKQFGGAGVGLATAQMLAQSMGIEVKVTSQPGIGSTFYFPLPVAQLDTY